MCQVSTSDISKKNTLQPKRNSLGVPILGNFQRFMFPPLKDTCPIPPVAAGSLSGSDPSMDFDSASAPTQADDAGRLDETHGT